MRTDRLNLATHAVPLVLRASAFGVAFILVLTAFLPILAVGAGIVG